jgi:hypothetical protein
MSPLQPTSHGTLPEPERIETRALDNLRFIRETMERAAAFTAVPGWGGAAMGLSALAAAAFAARSTSRDVWLAIWLVEAALAFIIGAAAMIWKARRAHVPLLYGAGRRFMLALCPPLVAGALVTFVLHRMGATAVLPGLWLLLYGAGVVTGGAYSVRIVPAMGMVLMAVGAAALFAPAGWGDGFMAVGFGLVQVVFGCIIARRHGG